MKTYKVSAFNCANELINKEGFLKVDASSTKAAINKAGKLISLKDGDLIQLLSEKGKLIKSVCYFK